MKYKFETQRDPKIEFGIILPKIIADLFEVAISENAVEDVLRIHLNIHPNRFIKLVEAVEPNGIEILILVIYDKILNKGKLLKEKIRVDNDNFNFDFNIYKYDFNRQIDVENSLAMEKKRKELK
ncbi:hypothetical protein [Caviibacter abscessus]|uniref:hypothetical protein n=1 Tax=Caviibacter abscessus TaxID=1766719 RepID=UPI00082F2189|nr:hypothetical protein [Caviibacter abscessus]